MCVVAYLLSLPLWERGFKHYGSTPRSTTTARRSPCGSVDLNEIPMSITEKQVKSLPLWERGFKRGVTRKIKNAIERADQGSFYFVLFPQFYMYQTNKLRKEKSKNRLKYNYEREKDENSIFRKNRCRKQ